jgi:hypothetical protein
MFSHWSTASGILDLSHTTPSEALSLHSLIPGSSICLRMTASHVIERDGNHQRIKGATVVEKRFRFKAPEYRNCYAFLDIYIQ